MMAHTAIFINLMRKQLTFMSTPIMPRKLSRKFKDRVKNYYLASLQQKEIFESSKNYSQQHQRQSGYNKKLNYVGDNTGTHPESDIW